MIVVPATLSEIQFPCLGERAQRGLRRLRGTPRLYDVKALIKCERFHKRGCIADRMAIKPPNCRDYLNLDVTSFILNIF